MVRPRVAAIIVSDSRLLVQRPSDDANACYAFIGGEYEVGDTFASRLKTEIEEDTTARQDVQSRESHLTFRWLPLNRLAQFDLRPHIVRDAVAAGEYMEIRHLVVPYDVPVD